MYLQSSPRHVTSVTKPANVRLLASMSSQVYPQRNILIEAFPTKDATIGLLSTVRTFVQDQIILFSEGFIAIATLMRLVTSMDPVVEHQFVLPGKTLPAGIAKMSLLYRLYAIVQLHVTLQSIWPEEGTLANTALVRHSDS